MNKPVLNIEQLTVESYTTSDADLPANQIGVGIIDTGCMSNCASGCGGFGDSICW